MRRRSCCWLALRSLNVRIPFNCRIFFIKFKVNCSAWKMISSQKPYSKKLRSLLFLLLRWSVSSSVILFLLLFACMPACLINYIDPATNRKLLCHAMQRWFFKRYWRVNNRLTLKRCFPACLNKKHIEMRIPRLTWTKKIRFTFHSLFSSCAPRVDSSRGILFFPDRLKCNNFFHLKNFASLRAASSLAIFTPKVVNLNDIIAFT